MFYTCFTPVLHLFTSVLHMFYTCITPVSNRSWPRSHLGRAHNHSAGGGGGWWVPTRAGILVVTNTRPPESWNMTPKIVVTNTRGQTCHPPPTTPQPHSIQTTLGVCTITMWAWGGGGWWVPDRVGFLLLPTPGHRNHGKLRAGKKSGSLY